MSVLFRPQDWPIAIKLVIAFLLVALTPLIIAGLLSQGQVREALLNEAKTNLQSAARRTSSNLDDFLKQRVADIQQTASLDAVVRYTDKANTDRSILGPNDRDQNATFTVLNSKASSLATSGNYLFLASKTGQVEITSNNAPNQQGQVIEGEARDLTDQMYFKEALKGQTYISDPTLTNFTQGGVEATMYISSPIRDVRGVPAGVLVLRFNLDSIWQLVNSDFEVVGKNSYTMLIDDTNNLGIRLADSRTYNRSDAQTTYLFGVTRPLPSNGRGPWVNSGRFPDNFDFLKANSNGVILPGLPDILDRTTYDRTNPFFTTAFNDGSGVVGAQAAYAPVPTKPRWSYFVVVPESTYAAAANTIASTVQIVIVLAIIAVILLALIMARLLTTPVRRITRVLGRIGIGDFDARVPVQSRDELGRLGESLNAMFDNTLTLIQSREEKEVLQEQITRLLQEISSVAEGDLTVQAEVTADVTGAIADSFNLMIEELRKIIINIQNATGQASTFFEQMVVNTQQIDKVSNRQASRVSTVSASVDDINRSIQQVSEAAVLSANVAQEARQNAHQGGLAVSQTIAGMNRIRGNVQETSKKIKRLGESSQQIGEIVKLIDDIADQTNMLALNAAIQAAMAGEQGKGFSVVSEEVRRLAERSATATREIAVLVKSIQDDTAEAVVAMEESTREVVDGSKVADEAGRALAAIEAVVDRLATLITNISVVSRQQATSSSNIAQSMVELSKLTQEATNLRQQSAQAVEVVARTADELRVSVSAFKVSNEYSQIALPNGLDEQALVFEPRPLPYAAPTGGAPAQPVSAPPPDYYQYVPPPVSMPESYQPPAGDGGSEPDYPVNPLLGRTQASASRNSSPFVATSPEDALDFDLNALLADDTIFDSIFDNGDRMKTPKDGDKQRPSPMG